MNRRDLLVGTAALVGAGAAGPALLRAARAQSAKTHVVFWHAMTAALGEEVNRLATAFNASQSDYEVQPVFKGSYAETLTAAIAAYRAGQAPNLVQVFEVGTGTMLAAGAAVKPAWQLIKETGADIKPDGYIPAVRGYYSLADGRMASVPFNSSTAVMWINQDAFEKAGLDPAKPPATYDEVAKAAETLKSKSGLPIAISSGWFSWIHLEEYAAIHNIAFASEGDGFSGLNAVLEINKPDFVKQMQRFMDWQKEGIFKYGGRDSAADSVFLSGQAAIGFNSSGERGDLIKSAKFKWADAFLPYDPAIIKQPINSIIGGASLWTMTAPNRPEAEYKAVAEFLAFLAKPDNAAAWHQHTGYVPVTLAGYELSKQQGYYDKNPGTELPIQQLTRGKVTDNSRGLRLGRLPEIRNIIYEEVEKALQGQQTAEAAMESAATRGNRVLREFEKSART
jgi:sn-glycerol 3-phosphate transport system substrate-binding protein